MLQCSNYQSAFSLIKETGLVYFMLLFPIVTAYVFVIQMTRSFNICFIIVLCSVNAVTDVPLSCIHCDILCNQFIFAPKNMGKPLECYILCNQFIFAPKGEAPGVMMNELECEFAPDLLYAGRIWKWSIIAT